MVKKIILGCFLFSSLTLSAQMPASYGSSGGTSNTNAEVISRVLFGSGNVGNPFSWSPALGGGGTDITNPNSTGNNILPCRGYSDYTIGNNNLTDGNTFNTEHLAIVERGMSYQMQILGQRCSGSGWGVPANTQRGIKVYIDYNQDGLFDPNLENVILPFQGTLNGWFPSFNFFNITIPNTAQTGMTNMRVVYARLGTMPFFVWQQIQPQGTYSFGETQDYSIEIAGLIDTALTTSISCNGADDGIIEIVPGAFAPAGLEYSITGMMGPFQSSATFSGLLPNTPYDVWVRDPATGELEEYDLNPVILTEPDPLTFAVNVSSNYNGSQISCTGATDGEITVTVSGGTAPFDYSIDNGTSFVALAASNPFTITALGDGTYDIFVQDANGCTTTATSISLSEPANLNAVVNITSNYNGQDISCVGAADGEVTIVASGGTAPYQFDFNNQGLFTTNTSINGLGSGTYDLLIADANSCSNSYIGIVTLTDPTPIVFGGATIASNYNGADITCFGAADGEISILASGGTSTSGDYTFLVDNSSAGTGPSPFSVSNLGEAIYNVTVEDDNGCSTLPFPIALTAPPLLELQSAVVSSAISCNGFSDGEITISALGGVGTIQYSIDNGASYGSSPVIGSLAQNSYSCYIIDDNDCEAGPEVVFVSEPSVLVLTGASVSSNYNGADISCVGSTDGEITVSASGGTPAYNFSLTGSPPFLPTNLFSALPAGTYDVVVQDANGCETPAGATLVTISSPSSIVSSALVSSDYNGQDISCNSFSDGEITVSSSGGTGTSYTYSLPAANYSGTSPYTITGLAAGGYPITVTDINGCTSTIPSVAISQPTPIVLNTSQLDAGCNGAADGSASVIPNGGTPGYIYMWDSGQMTANITDLIAGPYSVLVTDVNGCSQSTLVTILEPTINTIATDVSCFGSANGTLEAIITNGSNAYSFSWNDPSGQTTALATNLEPGVYTVTASDVFGCEIIATDSIFQPEEMTVNILSTTLCTAFELAKVKAEVDGGIMPYQFLWSTSESSSEIFVTDGSYNLDVTDAKSCVTTQTVVVEPYSRINISFTTTPASCIDNNDGIVASTVSGGYMPYEYYWSHGPQTPTINVAEGFYSLNLIDNEGCEASSDIAVSALDATCLELFSAFSPNGDQNNDYWYIGNIELYPDALVEVFNRWGDRVFAAKNYSNSWASAWNGMYEGKLLPSATYYYVITLNNSETPYRGNVTLVR